VSADRGGQKNHNGKTIVVFFAMFSTSVGQFGDFGVISRVILNIKNKNDEL
jgi:hypothetical protein